jgi:hypothetical protein
MQVERRHRLGANVRDGIGCLKLDLYGRLSS